MRKLQLLGVVAVLGIVGAACGDDDDDAGGAPLEAIGDGEGALNLVVWAG